MNKKTTCIYLCLLVLISIITIVLMGNTYTIEYRLNGNNDYKVELDQKKEIVKVIDKKIENDKLIMKVKGLKKGAAYITISQGITGSSYVFYVHSLGVITEKEYLGYSKGVIIIPICITLFLIYILIYLIKKYKTSLKTSIYQYKNIKYLGIIIFIIFILVNQLFMIKNNYGLIDIIRSTINSCSLFSIYIFPIAFITFIIVIISNLILIKKEGKNIKNLLGLFLGITICIGTLFPMLMGEYLQRATWIDVHNLNKPYYCIEMFIETIIFEIVVYLECILISTIILTIKAAKHIPKYDKDYILILGCKIKNDGSLTPLLKGRVDKAIEFFKLQKEKTNKDIIFIPSGGKGNDEVISEAEAMKNYLIEKGINKNKIILEDKSKNTYENIKNSNKIINKKANIAFSTTNYHVFRAGVIAFSLGLNIEGIGSNTKKYYFINAFIREFIATIYEEKKNHIKLIVSLILLTLPMVIIIYFSNMI